MKLFEIDNGQGLATYVVAISMDHAVTRMKKEMDREQWVGMDLSVNEVIIDQTSPRILGFIRYE